MLKSQSGFTPIIFLLAIVLVSGGVVGGSLYIKKNNLLNSSGTNKVTQTPTPNAESSLNSQVSTHPSPANLSNSATPSSIIDNWKVYSDKKNKVSFKYPADWKLAEATLSGEPVIVITDPQTIGSTDEVNKITYAAMNTTVDGWLSLLNIQKQRFLNIPSKISTSAYSATVATTRFDIGKENFNGRKFNMALEQSQIEYTTSDSTKKTTNAYQKSIFFMNGANSMSLLEFKYTETYKDLESALEQQVMTSLTY